MRRLVFSLVALTTSILVACSPETPATLDTDTETHPGDDTGVTAPTDADQDGVVDADDCDDTDPTLGASADDGDCDGTLTDADCDDDDATSTTVSDDGDCDGFVTTEDCDDDNPLIHPHAADGLLTDRDCDEGIAATNLSAAEYSFLWLGEETERGLSVSSAGDVDGDGLKDIAVGVSSDGYSEVPGNVFLFLGSSLGDEDEAVIDLTLADYRIEGTAEEFSLGHKVASAGDVDGDGLDDLLMSAYKNDDIAHDAGKVFLFLASSLGASADISVSDADYSFVGGGYQSYIGMSVSSAGDVDGDGLDDILIGAPNSNVDGMAHLILGASLGINSEIDLSASDYQFYGERNTVSYAGNSVSSAGDVDGDGLSDILIGAPYNGDGATGTTHLILGASLGVDSDFDLSESDYIFVGLGHSDASGWNVSSAGDVDGDSLDDILVGAFGYADYTGEAYLFLSANLGKEQEIEVALADYRFIGESTGDYVGLSLSGAGDVDRDGLSDILIGAILNDDGGVNAGKGYLIPGASLGSDAVVELSTIDHSFVGESAGDLAGSVAGAGDVNGDGRDDVLVGAHDGGIEEAPKAYLILSGL